MMAKCTRCGQTNLTADLYANEPLALAAFVADALDCAFVGVPPNHTAPGHYAVEPFDESDPEIVLTKDGRARYRLRLEDYSGPWE